MTNKEWLDYLAHNAPDELAAWFDAERITNQAEMLHMPESPTSGEIVAELQAEVDELTAERDKLQEQLRIGWECECRLQTERERYREKFGKCLDYADAIHALMDDKGMA